MPIYDVVCDQGHEHRDLYRPVTEVIACVTCGQPTRTLWTAGRSVIDNGWPGGRTFDNLGPVPIRFDSRSDFQRYLKKHQIEPCVKHAPLPGSDKSPHTTSWAAIGPETLASAAAMLERVSAVTHTTPDTYISQWTTTTTESCEPVQTRAPLLEARNVS